MDDFPRMGEAMTFPRLSLVLAMGIGLFSFYVSGTSLIHAESKRMNSSQDVYIIKLPTPVYKGTMSLEETLKKRASVRGFSSHPLKLEELSQLLWALQGTTRDWGGRTAPSAGALFPLEIWVVLKEGVFHYLQRDHQLICIVKQDLRAELAAAALGQDCVREAPAVFVITALYERVSLKYGSRAERYVKIEAGHAGQNLLLQAVSLGLGAVPIGAFHDDRIKKVLNLPAGHEPLYLIPAGRKR